MDISKGMSLTPAVPHHPPPPSQPNLQIIKQKLLKHHVEPTPKLLHILRKKELQKSNRRRAKQAPTITHADQQKQQDILEESHFQTIKSEYKKFVNFSESDKRLVGRPWESLDRIRMRELGAEYSGGKLSGEHLKELSDVIECERDRFSWLLDSDVDTEEGLFEDGGNKWNPPKRSEGDAVKLLVDRLSVTELNVKDWKFTKVMRHSGLQFTEKQMLKVVERLGNRGQWRNALSAVKWVYTSKEFKHFKSRFVYTKLLTVLGRAKKPREAIQVFDLMRGDAYIYPDMAAYHSLAVTLGQAGLLKELLKVIESMKEKPRKIRNIRRKDWNPTLQPDIVIYNAVLNACVTTCQWKGVSWVFKQLRKDGLRPNAASYGLAMEVMLKSGKYDLVHHFFDKMKRTGEALKAITYKVLVRVFWEEGKVDEAVQAVRDMERRGIIGTSSVYYELARCLCFYGRWQEAIFEIEKLKNLRLTKPLPVTITGLIMASLNGGHFEDCISLFEHYKTLMNPDIGVINAILKVYGRNDMFFEAKELFESTQRSDSRSEIVGNGDNSMAKADSYTYSSMLEVSSSAQQWEYFEYVYKEMTLSGHGVVGHKQFLLVEASKAGKWHLLEHAFNTMLDAGEIPPQSFFTEMTFQSIAQRDHVRAICIVNAMSHAPFQVTFQDWINLFETNRDRIGRDDLNEFLEKLLSLGDGDDDLVREEATVLNLLKSLKFICRSCEDSSGNLANQEIDDEVSENRISDGDGDSKNGSLLNDANLDDDFELLLPSYDSYNDDGNDDADDDDEDGLFECGNVPSAYEILESWRKK